MQVRNDAGVLLFSGFVTRVPQNDVALGESDGVCTGVRFEAAESAWLLGAAVDTSLQPASSALRMVDLEKNAVRLRAADDLAWLASDVAVSGAHEPTTYVTELFQGDGTTVSFALTDAPFHMTGKAALVEDAFDGPQFDRRVWAFTDAGSHIGLGSGGLSVSGGNGFDGQTVMKAVAPVEMGGTLTAELTGLTLQSGSDGVLLGFYGGAVAIANCFAGFRVKGTAGARTIVALVNGVETGSGFTFSEGHRYTLRLRLRCPEMQRVLGSYQAVVDGAVQTFGGGLVDAPMQVVFEVQDLGLASSTVATVLYAGAVASSPARCTFAPVNSVALLCQAGGCSLVQSGSAWVMSTLPDGTVVPRRAGVVDGGADYSLTGSTVLFFPGRVPVAGESVAVTYRRGQRASARLQDANALAAVFNQGLPGVPAWEGSVAEARSSSDCRAAAASLLAFGASAAVGVAGECTFVNEADVQPGDRLLLPLRAGSAVPVPVQSVTVRDGHATPEVLTYSVAFGQTRANGLSFAVQDGLAGNVPLPINVSVPGTVANLPALQVVSATASALQIDAGTAASNGGGFEVRRRDGGFGTDASDLVLRSPVRSFSVPRAAFNERFYVRMYDGSLPPVYSERSSLVVTHLPVAS